MIKDYLDIEVNNGCSVTLMFNEDGIEVIHNDSGNGIEYSYAIPEGELIMLLNYYRNCKAGNENSDYISVGKIRNTNTDTEEYIK